MRSLACAKPKVVFRSDISRRWITYSCSHKLTQEDTLTTKAPYQDHFEYQRGVESTFHVW